MRGFRNFILGNLILSVLVMFPDRVQTATGGKEPPQLQVQPPHLWSQRFGDGSNQFGYGVAFDSSGNVVVTGYFQGTVNFGGGTLSSVGGTTSSWRSSTPAALICGASASGMRTSTSIALVSPSTRRGTSS